MRTRRKAAGLALHATRAPALLIALATACGPAPEVGARLDGTGGGSATTFTEIRTLILEPRCATSACHSGPNPVASPRLDGTGAWDAIVDAPSSVPGVVLVAPERPDDSYLLLTLVPDAAAGVGGSTRPMPEGEQQLDDSEIEAIRAWIAAGAPND